MAQTKRRVSKKATRVRKETVVKKKSNWLIRGLFAFGVLIFVISGYFYYSMVYTKPENVFWGMIENNLATRGITRQVLQQGDVQNSDEVAQFNFGLPTAVRLIRTLSNDTNSTKIEGIGVATSDYQRYVSVSREDASGETAFDNILGKWVQTGSTDQSVSAQPPNILLRALLGPVLSGNLPAKARHDIVNEFIAKNVYKVDFNSAKKQKLDGKTVYQFQTAINLKAFTEVMQKYATQLGLPNADTIDPEAYQEGESINAILVVDVNSRQLTKILYGDSAIQESYTGYGVDSNIEAPKDYLSYEEFQKLLAPQQ